MFKAKDKNIYFLEASKKKIIIFLHGYRGDKSELKFLRNFVIKKLHFSYYCFNYGERNAKNEVVNINNACVEAEETVIDFLDRHSFKKVYLMGYSLGAGVAIKIAYNKLVDLNGLILISVFDNLKETIAQKGIKLSQKDNICSEKLVKKIRIPTALIHGRKDTAVPIQRGLSVYKNLSKRESLFISLNSGHYFEDFESRKKLCESVKKSLLFISEISK